jgi:hypothetical protein
MINSYWDGWYKVREEAYPYGNGNTYAIFKSAKKCGDPLKLCTIASVKNLDSEG